MGTNTDAIIEGQCLRDILDQPRALAATLAHMEVPKELSVVARRLREGEIKRVVLTGMGASLCALHPAGIEAGRFARIPKITTTE